LQRASQKQYRADTWRVGPQRGVAIFHARIGCSDDSQIQASG
jgi:hypothetical protein